MNEITSSAQFDFSSISKTSDGKIALSVHNLNSNQSELFQGFTSTRYAKKSLNEHNASKQPKSIQVPAVAIMNGNLQPLDVGKTFVGKKLFSNWDPAFEQTKITKGGYLTIAPAVSKSSNNPVIVAEVHSVLNASPLKIGDLKKGVEKKAKF